MHANMAAKLYTSIILLHFLLVSLIFLPSVCIKSRNKDLNLANSYLFHVKIPAECAGQTWLNKNLSNTPKRPVVEWRKRGSICVFLPPTSDQNVWMFMPTLDLQSLRLTPVTWSIYSCKAHTMRTAPICHHLWLARFIADKNYLLFVPKIIMTRNSGLVSGGLMQTGF